MVRLTMYLPVNLLPDRLQQILVLVAGTSSVFWGMHLSGAMGLPRRMPDSPDVYMHNH